MAEYKITDFTIIDGKTKENVREWICNNLSGTSRLPFLVRTNIGNFFRILSDNIDKINSIVLGDGSNEDKNKRKKLAKENIEITRKKVNDNINFLLNSSIWIRLCNNDDWDGQKDASKAEEIRDSIEEIEWFETLKLYEFKPAKEYIDYQLRAQSQNYLAEFGGHGVHITPMIYSNEVDFRNFFLKKDNEIHFKYLGNTDNGNRFLTKDIALRILLVDDKIWEGNNNSYNNNIKISRCGNCETCKNTVNADYCKLRIIHSLLSGKFILSSQKKQNFLEQTYWIDNVDSVVVEKVRISQIWEKGADSEQLEQRENTVSMLNNDLKPLDGQITNFVQIVGVRDLETALSLMSCCKFDIILLDYLLDKRSDDNPERTYSTELFEFLSYDFKNGTSSSVVEMLKKSSGFDNNLLRAFQDNVKLNRGPLDKYWIVPMTSYNSSSISDLQSKHVRLIDHRWNISQGADPINTPWKFLHKINEFIDLQLRSCVFHMEQLLRFLKYTCEDCFDLYNKKQNIDFMEFQSFMGSEYTSFMRRYGNRHLIQRDALVKKSEDYKDKSIFATYIWNEFYSKPTYYDVLELNRLAHKFYHQASAMYNDRVGRQRLNEAFADLDFFIRTNSKIIEIVNSGQTLSELINGDNGLAFLRIVIAKCTKEN